MEFLKLCLAIGLCVVSIPFILMGEIFESIGKFFMGLIDLIP